MRWFLFTFALFSLTALQAQNPERIFTDGKRVPNLVGMSSITSTTTTGPPAAAGNEPVTSTASSLTEKTRATTSTKALVITSTEAETAISSPHATTTAMSWSVPEEFGDFTDEADVKTEEKTDASPESEAVSEETELLIPRSTDGPSVVPLPTKDDTELIDPDSAETTILKNINLNDAQTLTEDTSAELAPSLEPEDLLPESSSEVQVSINSALGSILHSPPWPQGTPVPGPSLDLFDSIGAFPIGAFVESLPPSFESENDIGLVPVPKVKEKSGFEGLEVLESLEPTFDPSDVGDFFRPEEDANASDGSAISTEEVHPSDEMEVLEVDLIVKYPDMLDPVNVAEEIRLVLNELTSPMFWDEDGLLMLSNLTTFESSFSVLRKAHEVDNFELNLQSICTSSSGCKAEVSAYSDFVRNGRMDEALAARGMDGINTYLKRDLMDQSISPEMDVAASTGLHGGIIASITIGAVGCVSLLIVGILFLTKRGRDNGSRYGTEQGRSESSHCLNDGYQLQNPGEKKGSFIFGTFGRSPRNTDTRIQLSNETEDSSLCEQESDSSFITVDTPGSTEITVHNLPNYRYDETISLESDSDFEDPDVGAR